ncbi:MULTISPECIES: hypothetical protein [Neobacillus]|uniref:Uncharacterized protein n=1 Tax=Neobacillus rhizophilus TaxID=2833579 RepID=A0A942YST1_9BACI|nr:MULTISPECIES: hypothetical protein [Neobacillus]MBS4211182.1 hypothetical protein [Neobacillus rhizophilus]MBU8918706.1 hypothetical protein [Bacillus sp. FJAT-29953]
MLTLTFSGKKWLLKEEMDFPRKVIAFGSHIAQFGGTLKRAATKQPLTY